MIRPGAITLGPMHAAAMAAIHAACFVPAERWTAKAMAELLAMPGAFGLIDERGAFILARQGGGEVEILTLAVQPAIRRHGVGRALLAGVLGQIGDSPVFLEVAAGNVAAQALYAVAGFTPCGRRPDYYGPGQDAVILRR